MAIPDLDEHGLLPAGAHDCSVDEIVGTFGWNPHRRDLVRRLSDFLVREIRHRFSEPVYVDGSFVTDKETPDDVDVVLDMRRASEDRQFSAFRSWRQGRDRFRRVYSIDFWINLPGENDFSDFFQYLGVKTARYKGLDSAYRKGILRLP